MGATIYILMAVILLNGLLLAYNFVNTTRAFETMRTVNPLDKRGYKRKTYTETELARLDYQNYRTMFTISLIALCANAVTSGLLFYVFITLLK